MEAEKQMMERTIAFGEITQIKEEHLALLTEENKRMKAIVRMLMDKIKSGDFDDLKFDQAKQMMDKDPNNINPAASEAKESVAAKDEPA